MYISTRYLILLSIILNLLISRENKHNLVCGLYTAFSIIGYCVLIFLSSLVLCIFKILLSPFLFRSNCKMCKKRKKVFILCSVQMELLRRKPHPTVKKKKKKNDRWRGGGGGALVMYYKYRHLYHTRRSPKMLSCVNYK